MTLDVITTARRRTRRLLLVVGGVAGVMCALVYPLGLYANSRLDDNAPTPPTATTSTPAQMSGSPAPSAVAVVLPPDTTWTTVAGVALPVSATAGPLRRDHGLAAGFAHTPPGAVLAGVHLLVNTTPQVGPAVFEPTLRTQVIGENATAMRAAVEADYRQLRGDPGTGGPVGSLPAALAGAAMATFTDTTARVDLLTVAIDATGTARFFATLIDVSWTGSDWALLAPPAGRWDTTIAEVSPTQAAAYPPLAPGR